jgi:hypothetical protein
MDVATAGTELIDVDIGRKRWSLCVCVWFQTLLDVRWWKQCLNVSHSGERQIWAPLIYSPLPMTVVGYMLVVASESSFGSGRGDVRTCLGTIPQIYGWQTLRSRPDPCCFSNIRGPLASPTPHQETRSSRAACPRLACLGNFLDDVSWERLPRNSFFDTNTDLSNYQMNYLKDLCSSNYDKIPWREVWRFASISSTIWDCLMHILETRAAWWSYPILPYALSTDIFKTNQYKAKSKEQDCA